MNPSSRLVLTGGVVIPSNAVGSAVWSASDSSIQLDKIALMPVAVELSGSSSLYLALTANSLSAGSTLTFYLTCKLLNGQSSQAAVTVVTNSPPLAGLFSVDPSSGMELTDVFRMSATQWTDEDVPLSYQFAFVSPTGSSQIIRSRSELSYMSSTLPAGASGDRNRLTSSVVVFDSFLANSSVSFIVTVNPHSHADISHISNLAMSLLVAGDGSTDSIYSSAAIASATLNYVNCSSAPNCSALNRNQCSSTANTCGSCASDSFTGDEGDSNEACISWSDFESLLAVTSSEVEQSCASNADCASLPWHSCQSGVCVLNDKTCLGGCSGHGSCLFVQTDSGAPLTSCKVGQVGCNAVCECNAGWYEESCAVDDAGWTAATAVRFEIVSSLSALTSMEDATEDSVSGWSGALVAATQNSFELSSESVTSAQSLASLILQNALVLDLDHTAISGVLSTLNSLASAQVSNRRRRRLTNGGAATDTAQITNTELILQQFSQLVATGMLAGQGAVSNTQSQFRMITQAIAASHNASITTPLSAEEVLAGMVAPSISFQIDPQSSSSLLKVSSVLMNAGLYSNSDFQSNPLQIHFNSDMPCVSKDGSASCGIDVDVVLQNNSPLDVSDRTPEPYFSVCRFDDYSVHQYQCPDNFVLNASCNGTAQILSSRCPYTQPHSVCNSLVGSDTVYSGCVAVAYTATNTTCRCPIRGPAFGASRRLIATTDDDGNSSSALSSGSANFVSMLSFLAKDFTTTILSADSLSVSSVKSGWKVLATLGSLALAMVMFGLFAHKADGRMKKVKPTDKLPEATEAGSLTKLKKASLRGSQLINGVKTRLSTTEIQKFLRKRTSPADAELNQLKDIEHALPSMMRSTPFVERFTEEVKHFHKWLGVVFYYSDSFPRVLRIISLSTSVLAMLFVQSITYNLTNPDDGSCEAFTHKSQCLAEMSPFGTGDTKCYWDHGFKRGSCHFNQPAHNLKIILFVAIFAALISTPIALTADWVIMNILSAKTKKRTPVLNANRYIRAAKDRSRTESDEAFQPVALEPLAFKRRTGAVGRTMTAVSTDSSAPSGKRRFSIAALLQFDVAKSLPTTLQDDLSALLRGLCGYREELSLNQRNEFNSE
jgi:hypothetical protein